MLWHSSGSDTIWVWNLSAAFDLNKEVRTLLHKSIIKLRASKIAAKPSLIRSKCDAGEFPRKQHLKVNTISGR